MYLTLGNETTGNSTHLGNLEGLLHLNLTGNDFLLHLVEHTNHRTLDIVDSIVDDRVCVDFNTLTVGSLASIGRWTNLETNDDCI